MGFVMKDFVEFLESSREFGKSEMDDIMQEYLMSEGFVEAIFPTSKNPNDQPDTMLSNQMYNRLAKKRVLKSLCRVVTNVGPKRFSRSIATWLYSVAIVANMKQKKRVEAFNDAGKKFDPNSVQCKAMRTRERKMEQAEILEYGELVSRLTSLSTKIVQGEAYQISDHTGLPPELVATCLKQIPDPVYITNYRAGFYLNIVLTAVYRYIESNPFDTSRVSWGKFFRALFGEANVTDAATFILLEGVNRIENFKRPEVSECYTNLTMFALKQLERAPETLKNQMLELYIKRIGKMFANRTFDLRANLLELDPQQFPNLVSSIAHYADQISEIIYHSGKSLD